MVMGKYEVACPSLDSRFREYSCPECGGRIYSEDGMSRSELRRMEAMDDRDGDTEERFGDSNDRPII